MGEFLLVLLEALVDVDNLLVGIFHVVDDGSVEEEVEGLGGKSLTELAIDRAELVHPCDSDEVAELGIVLGARAITHADDV